MGEGETRTVRDPSDGESREVEIAERPLDRPVRAARLTPPPPLRLVIVDGVIRGEARLSIEVWELLEGLGLSRQDAIAATLRSRQLPDRIVIETGKKR